MNVMLLAAGEGTRLRPYTLEIPKPAIPFLGTPLAAYSLSLLEHVKVDDRVVNTHHLPEQIESLFYHLYPSCSKVIYSSERTLLLGSGGGIHNARFHLEGKGDFLVMNADEVILPHHSYMMEDFIQAHKDNKGVATLLTMNHPEVGKKFGGAWTEDSNEVKLFSKTSPGPNHQGHHFIGPLLLSDRVFNYFKNQIEVENVLYETLTNAISAGEQVYVHNVQCDWHETGNPQDFIHASELFLNLIKSQPESSAAQFLIHTMKRFGNGKTLIENESPKLLTELSKFYQSLSV